MGGGALTVAGAADGLAALAEVFAHVAEGRFGESGAVRFLGHAEPPDALTWVAVTMKTDGEPAGWLASAGAASDEEAAAWLGGVAESVGELLGAAVAVAAVPPAPQPGTEPLDGARTPLAYARGNGDLWLLVSEPLLLRCLDALGPVPAVFPSLQPSVPDAPGELDGLLDVPLQVSVELGRVERQIADLLALVPGAVLELDRLAGDPLDVLVNGRRIARAEVVVVDERFAIRITEILSPAERLERLA